ncbi:MAG: type IV pilus assembly protein PilM [Pirellulaceae bacterium]|nr:type IV pilus assembly protein PilM [Pirellulaceae bacterium]
MAKSSAVWGIEIGQSSLKALRCTNGDGDEGLSALAFDHIEYPQILSQADADPATLISEALELFLSRNEIRGDRVAVSVSGQNGLARFIKLPPVESKKLAAIVSYEAKQQIPFPLEEVVWDYQKMPGGSEEEGFALETEVGLFAMKRDQLFRAIQPLEEAGIELDVIQLAPLALFNFAVFDQILDLPAPEEYDPDSPPQSMAIVSVGTDATDLVITNGYRVWQRSIPLGGNHFTKQLTKELKLTFAKAEHLKRNAQEAQDSKAVFQAMRPVFKELVTELQRSIGFFQSLDRNAKISQLMVLGNAFKLPGLAQYIEKSLGISLHPIDRLNRLSGEDVVSTPTFDDNILTFPVCYGLCVQGLNQSTIHTNLIPREIVRRRMIRQKKPWVVSAVAVLLLGLMCNYFFAWNAWSKVRDSLFAQVLNQAKTVQQRSQSLQQTDQQKIAQYETLKTIGDAIVVDDEGRRLMPELVRAVYTALPQDPDANTEEYFLKPFDKRRNLFIRSVESQYFENLSMWWNTELEKRYEAGRKGEDVEVDDPADGDPNLATAGDPNQASGQPTATQPNATQPTPATPPNQAPSGAPAGGMTGSTSGAQGTAGKSGPQGAGWVYELTGHHFYNSESGNAGQAYVRNTLIRSLMDGTIELPDGPEGKVVEVTMEELGIRFPVLVNSPPIQKVEMPNPAFTQEIAEKIRQLRMETEEDITAELENFPPETIPVKGCMFTVQFCWQETPVSKRQEERLEKEKEEEKAEANGLAGTGNESGVARSGGSPERR